MPFSTHRMTMRLELDKTFTRRAKKLLQRHPFLKKRYFELLTKLSNNPFDPTLHTHPLKGNMEGKYACSLTYELRVVFRLYDDIIHLLDIGSHDEVY
ncbi:MAG: type II toxin-antitoxin system mRNA interferase toxin, RelE/StbE family [Nitrospinae bacterium]|nr:type II toxin-antitoxin system mRNA interferase toxin, RelE/StbE family [Nitrospinota bacterium]MBI3815849.1 type II toxin-antitoxin system mRNA interferase toxin, RelE/StbE family [Nitrospinota bacterium]